jgi:hypothetical protein
MNKLTVILSGFMRPHALQEQYDALKAQTFTDFDIMLWVNVPDTQKLMEFPKEVVEKCQTIVSNSDYGSWGRFVSALNAKTDYIHVIDDDTIPGTRWLENCWNTMEEVGDGVLSTRGVIMTEHDDQYPLPHSYSPVGWCAPNEDTTRVDMGCHSWFFRKDILRAYFAEMPTLFPQRFGEDTHIAYAAKKLMGVNSYVPKHPKDDTSLWGSMRETALRYGEEPCAISMSREANIGMNKYWNFVKSQGYRTMLEERRVAV